MLVDVPAQRGGGVAHGHAGGRPRRPTQARNSSTWWMLSQAPLASTRSKADQSTPGSFQTAVVGVDAGVVQGAAQEGPVVVQVGVPGAGGDGDGGGRPGRAPPGGAAQLPMGKWQATWWPGRDLAHFGDLLGAAGLGPRAAGAEAAARRRVDRARRLPGQGRRRARRLGVGLHGRGEQGRRVVVGRRLVEQVGRCDLAQAPEVHDGHPVAHVLDDGQVVRNEEDGQVVLLLQVLQQVEDLRLHRHVEGGDDLVADEQLRLEHEGAGDADALALAAGELAGPPGAVDVGVDADLVEHGVWPPRRRSSLVPIFQMVSGSATMSITLRRGLSDEIGSWKIICTWVRSVRRSPRLSAVSSVSPKRILPEVAFSTWTMARPVVDLPQPDSPTRPSVSPWRMVKVMPATACTVDVAPAEGDVEVLDREERVGRHRRRRRPWCRSCRHRRRAAAAAAAGSAVVRGYQQA